MSNTIELSDFIVRKSEINNIISYFKPNNFSTKKVYSLFGKSGIGKSYVCKYINDNESLLSNYYKILIDFNSQKTRSIINLIEIISYSFYKDEFEKTEELLNKYYNSIDSSKPVFFNELYDVFLKELNCVARNTPVLILLDTIEVVYGGLEWEYIEKFINETSNKICFLCSGINEIVFDEYEKKEIVGFSDIEIIEYFSKRVPKLKRELKSESSFLLEKIRRFTKDGHPILCGLLSDWLIETPSQLEYVLDNEREISERLIISEWVKEASIGSIPSNLLKKTLGLMSYFTKRMDSHILANLLDVDDNISKNIIEHIGTYSFVKYFKEDGNIILHDIVAELLKKNYSLSNVDFYYKRIIELYDDMILQSKTNISPLSASYLKLERIYYIISFEDESNAITCFEREFLANLDSFDFSLCNVLLAMIHDNKKSQTESWDFTYELLRAELLLLNFKPQKAIELYDKLQKYECYKTAIFKAKADEIYAESIMNPCTLPKLDINTAISLFKTSIQIYNDESLTYRLSRSWFHLGMAYVRVGRSIEAKEAYENAQKHSNSKSQKISILMELSKMLRLQQFVDESLRPLTKCESLIGDLNVNKGKYFYYLGNALRDLNEFEEAENNYEAALRELQEGIDDFTLAELYLDYSWMEYLRSEHVNFKKVYSLLELGRDLAFTKGFGTEFSEYHHILYEIERDKEDFDSAFENLSIALNYAREYSNIYMILDCLNHLTQKQYIQGEFDEIPKTIEQMEDVEKTGCGIRVFRGRAKLIQGDVFYKLGKSEKAFNEWKEGFCIVALYGNSRTNVELFEDLFNVPSFGEKLSRKDKMKQIMIETKCISKRKLKQYWSNNRVPKQFDYFIEEICE